MPRQFGLTGVQQYAAAPTVGVAGATYFNTTDVLLYFSDGTKWIAASEVVIQPGVPALTYELWIDTDDTTSYGTGYSPGPWQTLPLSAGLQAYSAIAGMTPQYRLNGEYTELRGWIQAISGNVQSIASWPTVATLPAEARPTRPYVGYAAVHQNPGSGAFGNTVRIEVAAASGAIYLASASGWTVFNWVGLDGWTFSRT